MSEHANIVKAYWLVFAGLMALLVVTVIAAFTPLGWFNLPVALTIAIVKAVMIVLVFMHVKYNTRLVQVFAGAAFLWFVIMIGITFGDYLSRGGISAFGR
jgi:cytochrome c oxidase subunit 4